MYLQHRENVLRFCICDCSLNLIVSSLSPCEQWRGLMLNFEAKIYIVKDENTGKELGEHR